MSTKKWYAVYTRPRWEKKVAVFLTRKGIENYCPLNQVLKQWADRKKIVLEPLFKSYVFVKIEDFEQAELKKTDGILNLVYWLGKPAVISETEIESIQRFLGEFKSVSVEKTPINLNDVVRVTSGPFFDQSGRVVAVKSKTVRIILPSLGYMMSAELASEKVEVIRHTAHLRSGSIYLEV